MSQIDQGLSRVGYIAQTCHGNHCQIGIIVTGSSLKTAENLPAIRLGDVVVGCFSGVIVT